jgi:transglutaminase-like putative cysteine protease
MYLAEPAKQTLMSIPDGPAGIGITLDYMTKFVRQYKSDPTVRNSAIEHIKLIPQKNFTGEVYALFQFVQNEIRYTWDIADIETLQTPVVTLNNGVGDCDDKATLLAALLESIGHKTRFVAAGFKGQDFSHVFLETRIGDNWVTLDATEPYAMGWRPPGITSTMVRHN